MATVTDRELFSTYLKEELESQQYKEKVKSIQDWLTGQTQLSQQQYQATSQTAAQQASYDISGAYANYLKQQRNITAQGRLESGHKEELGDVLQQQYQSAYGQAKATQAQKTAEAYETHAKNIEKFGATASKEATAYYESAVKKAELNAQLYKAAEEYSGFGDESQFDLYTSEGNKFTLSGYGLDLMSSKILDETGGFKKYLEDNLPDEVLDYYLANFQQIHKELFGITDTKYDATSEESYQRRLGAVSKDGKTSYIDTLQKPTLDVNYNDFSDLWDFGTTGFNKLKNTSPQVVEYASKTLGLTDAEIATALLGESYSKLSAEQAIDMALSDLGHKLKSLKNEKRFPKQEYDALINKLTQKAKSKYIKE